MGSTKLLQINSLYDMVYEMMTPSDDNVKLAECSYVTKGDSVFMIELYYDINIKRMMPYYMKKLYSVRTLESVLKISVDFADKTLSFLQKIDLGNGSRLCENGEINMGHLDVLGGIDSNYPKFINKYIVKEFSKRRMIDLKRQVTIKSGKTLDDIVNYLEEHGVETQFKGDKNFTLRLPKDVKPFSIDPNNSNEVPFDLEDVENIPSLVDSTHNVYLGNVESTSYVDDLGIKCVISCLDKPDVFNGKDDVIYYYLGMGDNSIKDLDSSIRDALHIITDNATNNIKTLIHCKTGRGRSVSIAIAWMIFSRKTTFANAYWHIKQKHTPSELGINFVSHLERNDERIKNCYGLINHTFKPDNIMVPPPKNISNFTPSSPTTKFRITLPFTCNSEEELSMESIDSDKTGIIGRSPRSSRSTIKLLEDTFSDQILC